MKTVTFSIKDKGDYKLLVQFAKRLGIDIVSSKKSDTSSKKAKMKKLLDSVEKGELFKEVKDPVQWQKDIRDEWESH